MSSAIFSQILFIFFAPILLRQTLVWLYIWQKKEYRGDKMWDYLSLPEAKKIIFNFFNFSVLGLIILNLLTIWIFPDLTLELNKIDFIIKNEEVLNLKSFDFIEVSIARLWSKYGIILPLWLVLIFSLSLLVALESLYFWIRILLKKYPNLPKFTSKASLVLFLTLLTLIFLIWFTYSPLPTSLFLIIALYHLWILLLPILIGLWLLLLFPLDYFLKSRIFLKAKAYRQKLSQLKVLAVSGAYGKTTTKEYLDQLLGVSFQVEKTYKNQNSNISCARKTLALNPQAQIFLCELGAYKKGDGSEICQFVLPNMAIITGLNLQHFSLFGSEDNIIFAESESIRFLEPASPIFINYSSPMARKIPVSKNLNLIRYGLFEKDVDKDIYAENIREDLAGIHFDLVYNNFFKKARNQPEKLNKFSNLKTNIISLGNLENLVGAIAVCLYMANEAKLEPLFFLNKLKNLNIPEGVFKPISKPWGYLYDDSYNANLDGIINALKTVRKNRNFIPNSKLIVVLDDILELGKESLPAHQKVAQVLAEIQPDELYLPGRSFSLVIKEYLLEAGFPLKQIFLVKDSNLIEYKKKINDQLDSKNALQQPIFLLLEGYASSKFKPQ